jgi:GNAT superfamily N-acetyltransferase
LPIHPNNLPDRTHLIIASRLPDLPRWVEARALLLQGSGEIYGFQEQPGLAVGLRDPETQSIFIIGAPAEKAIRTALERNAGGGELIASLEQTWLADSLPGWTRTRIIVHRLVQPQRLTEVPPGMVGFLDPAVLHQLPIEDELVKELQSGAKHSVIAATFVDRQPVSFCYAGAITESLWDISIDTLPEYRRKGYAALCVTHMIYYMEGQGKQPVWQAVEENPASYRLAQKLGFMAVDELMLFTPGKIRS